MDYFDTDVLINAFVLQNINRHEESIAFIEQSIFKDSFLVSWITIQEVGFVLGKLRQDYSYTTLKIKQLITSTPVSHSRQEFDRAIHLASIIGYSNFNDCLHLAIAERYCKNLYTYNRSDFSKLIDHTILKIKILE
ncbi:type II toxin-antitoxin system VapC family toxin [Dyadobacter sp. CY312]|uniref:type II toxin-antitoxin system VapC family toxin n=1 Tax=Dyadobacter sp. CY312 TaxID=2907303 RepID=UPI001F1FD544|nr:type II toxin-antitoxin system VapC family toxin [Dyadobacter sp. CY312]MCE7038789.1 type II toxin-antitoxin system VapC family toxin [Dyadobacter sp. CY312]